VRPVHRKWSISSPELDEFSLNVFDAGEEIDLWTKASQFRPPIHVSGCLKVVSLLPESVSDSVYKIEGNTSSNELKVLRRG